MQLLANLVNNKLAKQPRTVAITCIYALAAGIAAVAFQLTINFLFEISFVELSRHSKLVFVCGSFAVIVISSLAAGWLLNSYSPEAAGSGIPQLKLAFWMDFGAFPWRAVWVKFVAGVLSIAGGSSLGREGPSVHLAGGLASVLGGLFGEPKQNRRRAAAAGAAAGLAAAFNTPIAAITFVLEEIIEDLNSRFLGSVLLASVIGALVVHGLVGKQPAFFLANANSPSWLGYVLIPLVSGAASLGGIAFQKATLSLRASRRRLSALPAWTHPALGGLITWCLGVSVYLASGHLGVFSLGYEDLSDALANKITWQIGALLLITKLAATVACYGLGGCGGIFSPTLFIGGMASVAISGMLGLALPLLPNDHLVLAVVGMSSCLGAVVGAPVTGILIVFEMTHEFALVPALMLGALFSQSIRRALSPRNFYEAVIHQEGHNLDRVIPPRDLHDWQQLPVSAIANFQPVVLSATDSESIRNALATSPYSRFPVFENSECRGILLRSEAEAAMKQGRLARLEKAAIAHPKQTIREVQMQLLNASGSIVIVLEPESGKLLGLLTLHDLLRAQHALAEKKA